MDTQNTISDNQTSTVTTPVTEYDIWVKEKIQNALDRKKSGLASYTDLRKIAEKYSFDAS